MVDALVPLVDVLFFLLVEIAEVAFYGRIFRHMMREKLSVPGDLQQPFQKAVTQLTHLCGFNLATGVTQHLFK